MKLADLNQGWWFSATAAFEKLDWVGGMACGYRATISEFNVLRVRVDRQGIWVQYVRFGTAIQ